MWEQLMDAIKNGVEIKVRELLIKMEPLELNNRDQDGYTALILAASKGLKGICELLIQEMVVDPSVVSRETYVQLRKAGKIREKQKLIDGPIKILYPLPKDIDATNKAFRATDTEGNSALMYAARNGWQDICKELILRMDRPAIDAANKKGETALMHAAIKGQKTICELLILKMSQEAIDANTKGSPHTALTWAIIGNHIKICELLIEKMGGEGVKGVSVITGNRHTAFTLAADKGWKDICKLLIPKMSPKACSAVSNKEGNTALILTAKYAWEEEMCEQLIKNMSSEALSAVNKQGNTALILAAKHRWKDICKQLIPLMSKEAINAANMEGHTALTLAADKGLNDICKQLIPLMSKEAISAVDKNGFTALMVAANEGLEEICKQLIPLMSKEAINAVNKYGYTALTIAAQRGLEKVSIDLIFIMNAEAINAIATESITLRPFTALKYAGAKYMALVCKMLMPRMDSKLVEKAASMAPILTSEVEGVKMIKSLQQKSEDYAEKLASFIIKMFSESDNPELNLTNSHAFKLYQETNREVLKSELAKLHIVEGAENLGEEDLIKAKAEGAQHLIEKTDNYIRDNYFTLAGISKNTVINSILPPNCVKKIISFASLSPFSLLDINSFELDVKATIGTQLQEVRKMATAGKWGQELSLGGIESTELAKKLEILNSAYLIKIAKMLYFQAINLGIMDNKGQDLTCAIGFAKEHPEIVKEVITTHPKYFVNRKIAEELIKDETLLAQVINQLEQNDILEVDVDTTGDHSEQGCNI